MRVGFTGTRQGMTGLQRLAVKRLLAELCPSEAHHGDCLGADAEFHLLAYSLTGDPRVVGHPPANNQMRAYCGFDYCHVPKPYLDRNHDIVDETDVLIAAPWGYVENERSGTWATVRYARRQGRKIYLVLSDGTVKEEAAHA